MQTSNQILVCLTSVVVMMMFMNCSGPRADIVLRNGTIYTVDHDMSTAAALAVGEGKIIGVGSNEQMESLIGPNTRVIDLKGKTVVPGLIDSHYHFIGVGQREFNLNLDGTVSMAQCIELVKAELAKKKAGEWVTGRGWIEEDWPSKRFPTRTDLDKISPDNPVLLSRADGHAVVVNSRALKIAQITRETKDPQGGEILHDRYGEPNGLLLDRAMGLVRKHMPPDTTAEMTRKYAMKADQVALAYGLTQIHDMGTGFRTIAVYKDLYANDDMKIRINAYIRGPGEDSEKLLEHGPEIGLFHGKLNVRGIKISQDGSLGSRGAALLEPYSDANTSGLLIFKDEEIYPTIKRALESNIQMVIHAIGDRANRDVLDLYEKAFKAVPAEKRVNADPRFRIEHSQIVHLDDIPRFAKLGVIPSMQPSHAIGDLHFALRRLGMARAAEGYAWQKFIDQGNYIPAGSDAPVEEGNPMIEFYAAVTRKDTTGFSADGWHPEYKMTRAEALKSLTIWGARAAFDENIIGSLEVGKYADLVVLDRDLMTEPEDRLFDIKALMTMVAGEIVFDRGEQFTAK